jgi:hypothetical protein
MADDSIVHIAENSPEEIAYKLFESIAFVEGKSLRPGMTGQKADRAYILSTYWECCRVVQGVGTEEWDEPLSSEQPTDRRPEPPDIVHRALPDIAVERSKTNAGQSG